MPWSVQYICIDVTASSRNESTQLPVVCNGHIPGARTKPGQMERVGSRKWHSLACQTSHGVNAVERSSASTIILNRDETGEQRRRNGHKQTIEHWYLSFAF